MEWWGPSRRFEFIDHPDELFIRVTSLQRKGDLIWPAAAGLACPVSLCFDPSVWIPIFSGFVCALMLYGWFHPSTSELLVTAKKLECRTPSGLSNTSISWSEIQRLEYRTGGEYDPTGLYAKKSFWTSVCILSGINEQETDRVLDAINTKFPTPQLAKDDGKPLFREELTSLGLSKRDRRTAGVAHSCAFFAHECGTSTAPTLRL